MSDYLPPPENPPRTASMIHRIVASSLRQRFLVILMTIVLTGAGTWSLNRLSVDAYPDLSPPMVEIITQWPGHAAEEVERLITVPVEVEMNGIAHMTMLRSISLYGLSDVILTFRDSTDNYFARERVFNRIPDLSLPNGVTPSVSPLSSPSGLIYRYVLQSPDRSPMELKTLEDWVIERQYKSVPGVADDSELGGETMQYQVLLDPIKTAAVGLSVSQVESALTANNGNAGGGFYSQGGQFYYVRGLGLLRTTEDIGNVVVTVHNGTPVLVKDVGQVVIGHAPRLGQFGYMSQDDEVEGVILMRTGEQTQNVLRGVEAKTKELNERVLPKDVKILPFYDRSELVSLTTETVEQNLLRGMLLVVVVLIFFLYDIRAGLIVAVAIPLALLFAFICLNLQDVSANLLSIGAVDFGILVDGAVVMVENIYRQVAARRGESVNIRQIITAAAAEVDRPIFYAVAVIAAGFLPIYVLSGPSGKLFKPMADTMIYALVGSLVLTLTLLPVLCSWAMRKGLRERRNVVFEAMKSVYTIGLDFCLAHPWATTIASALVVGASLLLVPQIGAEFMPRLDEGALWVRATMPYTISFDESRKVVPEIRQILRSFPQVTTVASEHGRPDDGTDPTGFFNVEFYVGLKPYGQWTGPYRRKTDLIDAINKKLQVFPGIIFNYTQPAEDAVDEAETGLKSSLAVKIFGSDLVTLEQKGRAIKKILERVRGIQDVTLVQELGQPSLTIDINRDKIARYGVNVSDINSLIQAAIGGDVATEVVQGEKQFDLVVRLQQEYRDNPEQIRNILVSTPAGQQIPLSELADIQVANGASFIYRQNNSRYIGVQFSVVGRDLAGAVQDAMRQVEAKVKLPSGYRADWGGEYTEYTASRHELSIILPLTLFLIFLILFALYSNLKFPFITVLGVLLSAPVGGILALWVTGTPFSVSSGIGFLALFGVSVQTAVVYISYVNELRRDGTSIEAATREGAILRLRPIMMTALVAALGLLPAALATGVGTDSQRPFALVIVSGLFSRLLISVFLMPALYLLVARSGDRLEV
ncbi:MAG TPA: CusA/CzcA family heavy metal efflux RND transporter [Verrucomicrobiae bacterium]|jgi:cobalt-zinc-cadmium resistance protein CzcA|nr:CusA/CzcA family heavy metal efflux RND transporter [Verrucomicrobiae bacterium]